MTNWKKALALALGLPSAIIGVFFFFQHLVTIGVVTQGWAQIILIAVVAVILLKMVMITWNKKK